MFGAVNAEVNGERKKRSSGRVGRSTYNMHIFVIAFRAKIKKLADNIGMLCERIPGLRCSLS